jgi:hypothetical protein
MFRRKLSDPLDYVLFTFPDGTPFTRRDVLRSVEILGITGSGKSSGSLAFLIRMLLADPCATMLLICQKPEERPLYEAAFARAGKELIVVDPSGKARCNFLETEIAAGADDRALTDFFVNQGEALQAGESNQGKSAKFFRQLEDRMTQMSFGALRMSGMGVTAENLRDFIGSAAYSNEDLRSERFRSSFHYRVMKAADQAPKCEDDAADFANINAFFANEFVNLDNEPRSSAISGILNTAHTFCSGLVRRLCGTTTNVSPTAYRHGVSILVDLPYTSHGPTGRFVAGGMMFLTQRDILRRTWDPSSYYTIIICDEFQESVTDFCSRFIGQSRSHGGALLTATQTLHATYSAMSGRNGHHKADSLNSNYGLHIYHTVDAATAKFASELLGMRREVFVGMGERDQADLWSQMMGRSRFNANIHEQWQPVLQPSVLMSGLRSGGPANDYCVDGVCIRLGEPFRGCRANWQVVTFRQS